jgi:hypothetical protein
MVDNVIFPNKNKKFLEFLYYVGKNYIGLSEWEERSKALAFLPRADEDRMMAGLVGHSTPIGLNKLLLKIIHS